MMIEDLAERLMDNTERRGYSAFELRAAVLNFLHGLTNQDPVLHDCAVRAVRTCHEHLIPATYLCEELDLHAS